MDTRNLMEYPDELADLLRERFGPKKDRNQPTRYMAAVYMTRAMAGLLSEEDFAAFLQSALRADAASQRPGANWPFPRSFMDRFARELRTHLGPLEEAEGREEAWHIMFALHGILAPDLVGPFIRCAHDAWKNTVELTQRMPAARA
ncbi:hypothetical protein [Streptomyces sp. MUM 16J]|uniref:hypothetical protein n=2 Tax=unclassified Streptomyces TaxID=2593676 RepID=UPI001F04A912|nr:hypothetical protein [Streptomyces sp. MUM 16J]MCH0560344.1 hypothetical protein [Streptomyces sp. MUM 16J]